MIDKNTTFAEAKGEEPINWFEELRNVNIDEFSRLLKLKELSEKWPTCAVGNQCDIIPRGDTGAPFDIELRSLGQDFPSYFRYMVDYSKIFKDCLRDELSTADDKVCLKENLKELFENKRMQATIVLNKIEARSAILIAKQNNSVIQRLKSFFKFN